jgi:tetratricopeptide (TPR) repeat protein
MIVKNEEKNLPRCLESVRGMVDEIVVLDTGSVDNTISICESFGAGVFRMPWPGDFAAARNESLKKAHGNWILYLDADEAIDPNGQSDCIRRTASIGAVDAWTVPIRSYKWNSSSYDITYNIRLFRNLPGLLFENEVHERIEPALTRIGARMAAAPFFIDHFGYRLAPEAMREKLERNLLLSQKHLQRVPDDPYCLYYVGASLFELEKNSEALEYFQRTLDLKDIPLLLEAMTCNLMAFVELRENMLDEALLHAGRSIGLVPRQNTACLVSAIALLHKAEFGKAFQLLKKSHEFQHLPSDRRSTDLSQEHTIIDDVEFHRLLGICLSEISRPREAVEHFREFFALGGEEPDAARRAGLCCLNAGDFACGLEFLKKAEHLGADKSELALPLAFACLKTGDLSGAAQHFCSARPRDEGEIFVAFAVLEAMTADKAFRPYLMDCIGSKKDTFGRACPERFLKLVSEVRTSLPQYSMTVGVPN